MMGQPPHLWTGLKGAEMVAVALGAVAEGYLIWSLLFGRRCLFWLQCG